MTYRAPRMPADARVEVTTQFGGSTATMRNISAQGLCLATPVALIRGAKVRVLLAGTQREAMVMWSRGGQCGLRLKTALSDAELHMARSSSAHSASQGGYNQWGQQTQRFREM